MTLADALILAATGLVAGIINTIAGGGSLLTLPALMLIGDLPGSVANGTNRVSVVLQSLASSAQFHRDGAMDASLVRRLLPPICAGALVGAAIATVIDNAHFKTITAVVMVLMLPVILLKPHKRAIAAASTSDDDASAVDTNTADAHTADASAPLDPTRRLPRWAELGLFGLIGIYGGFIQAGVGVFLLAAIALACGQDLVRANAVKVALALVFATLALALFWAQGLVAWAPGLVMALGSSLGGWLGSKLTLSWGPKLVQAVLVITVLASATKLLGVW